MALPHTVVVPLTYSDYTSRRVLTTEWLDGEKLSQSKADDVGQLVNVGVICYLKQLLDTGFFHADPHPGNLIRTPDGRLAILDFGLMTEVCGRDLLSLFITNRDS
ncbi:putative aarF domain-containing protein kinase [Monoraphidium neglectum]|uniref:Putative aarF domain-containing protein kinase n=1 Tax=Monoraphidium neglectum TaxID=145388 RepID=A0A0D2LPW4_9CHLO|nr:putative aarF domain-containing protein kinase [Monoraphidium neglectum]KIY92001.1 putative aarF domain-containing protein kinase [Monoraphidium neglectum]|eukprot:XP_013891021.1 putative aarF domain-containing protein kinase [Monoraphidium neglectum]